MRVGDRVQDKSGLRGVVVADFASKEFGGDFPSEQWSYLETGVLVDTVDAGLVHFPDVGTLDLV